MIFISRHRPADEQIAMAKNHGFDLIWVKDMDAFSASIADDILDKLKEHGAWAVACVHPVIAIEAMRLTRGVAPTRTSPTVGVFENENRAPEGEKPRFKAKSLRLFKLEVSEGDQAWSGIYAI